MVEVSLEESDLTKGFIPALVASGALTIKEVKVERKTRAKKSVSGSDSKDGKCEDGESGAEQDPECEHKESV